MGEKFTLTDNLLTIYNVFDVTKKEALNIIKEQRNEHPNYSLFVNRSDRNMHNEFCVHKWFYNLGIQTRRTKDADIQYPLQLKEKIGYFFLGPIAKIFVK